MRPNKGVVVTSITPERLAQIFEVMGEIEAACARFAARRMTAEERQRLAALHVEAGALARAGDREACDAMNTRFHSAIYAGVHNDYLQETAQAVRRRLRPFRRAQFHVSGRLVPSWLEHDSVVCAILHGDGEVADHALRLHVTMAADASAGWLADRSFGRLSRLACTNACTSIGTRPRKDSFPINVLLAHRRCNTHRMMIIARLF
ncbi:GntR family transcriptional regulator [Azospirillum endophyticum]